MTNPATTFGLGESWVYIKNFLGESEDTTTSTSKGTSKKSDDEGDSTLVKPEIRKYSNEFSELYWEIQNHISLFRDRYPLITLVTMVFASVLGLSHLFQFSLTGLTSCVIYWTFAGSIAQNISQNLRSFAGKIQTSIFEFLRFSNRPVVEVTSETIKEKKSA